MRSKLKTWFKRHSSDILIDTGIAFFVLALILAGGLFIWISTLEIPDLSSFEQRRILQSTKIYDRTGEILLYDLHQDVRRTIVPFENISYHMKNATVAIEDDDFYKHFGVSPTAILRAAISNFTAGDLLGGQGGSTITQQVIKNSILEQEKRLTRKIMEAILALKIERVLTKDEILGYYLNESPYGGTIYGVEEASQAFFGKSASDLTLPEAAYLAALPQAPTYLSPYGTHKDDLDSRQKQVLNRMLVNGFITQEEHDTAAATAVEFQPQAVSGIRAPHFVMYIREQLVEKYGEEALSEKGLRVVTTLDWELQQEAERIVSEKALTNEERFNASNAGLVAIDPQKGDVLVMVGSRNYFDEEIDGNFNVALSKRQPGSSIKPIVYASAFSKGYTPETKVFDVKTQFSSVCEPWDLSNENPCYSPNNYNNKFVGPISLRNALAQSLNIPAVKVLYLTGIKDAIKLAGDMGITTLNDPDRLGLTLVLGGGEVTLLEHTGAYAVFANEGVKVDRRAILRIEDSYGNVLEEPQVQERRVLDRDVTLQISDILTDNNARAPLWGYNSQINFPNRDVAAKSGSTNNSRDAWIMGYAPNIAVGVWVGNNDNAPMNGLSGLIATPMWREFMDIALAKVDEQSFAQPPAIDPSLKPILRGEIVDAGLLIQSIQSGSSTMDIAGVTGSMHNILHYVDKSNPTGPYPSNPSADSQYNNWEYAVQKWVEATYASILPPTEEDGEDNSSDDNNDEDSNDEEEE
jgi:1A family penicillin-binding protein